MKRLQFLEMSIEDIKTLLKEAVNSELQKLIDFSRLERSNDEERLLTREQACELLQIDPSTLWHWQNKGKIQGYAICNRRYYKYHEIMESLIPLKTAS